MPGRDGEEGPLEEDQACPHQVSAEENIPVQDDSNQALLNNGSVPSQNLLDGGNPDDPSVFDEGCRDRVYVQNILNPYYPWLNLNRVYPTVELSSTTDILGIHEEFETSSEVNLGTPLETNQLGMWNIAETTNTTSSFEQEELSTSSAQKEVKKEVLSPVKVKEEMEEVTT